MLVYKILAFSRDIPGGQSSYWTGLASFSYVWISKAEGLPPFEE
jgi:hypothetical protein